MDRKPGSDGHFLLLLDDRFLPYKILSFMRAPYLPTKGFGKQEITQCAGAGSNNKAWR